MVNINIEEAKQIIEDTKGKIFGVSFIKKDGLLRKMSCRLGVAIGVKGVVNRKEEDEKYGYITVYDFNADSERDKKGNYRRINLNTLKEISFQGERFKINV